MYVLMYFCVVWCWNLSEKSINNIFQHTTRVVPNFVAFQSGVVRTLLIYNIILYIKVFYFVFIFISFDKLLLWWLWRRAKLMKNIFPRSTEQKFALHRKSYRSKLSRGVVSDAAHTLSDIDVTAIVLTTLNKPGMFHYAYIQC